MIRRKNLLITIFFITGTLLVLSVYHKEDHTGGITYDLFNEDAGWGYDILKNGEIIIHQDKIPVIQESRAFESEIQARSAARLVVKKIEENKAPTLSKEEIDNIVGGDK